MSTLAAMMLFLAVLLYAVFGGADFGAGFWDLTAGGDAKGRPVRELIDRSIGPVWEANHVWLIFCLVILWTAFPAAFAAIMATLFVPLGLAALGIVLRGSGFAFRKASSASSLRRAGGIAFASSSVLTPFFFGTVAGAIASGRIRATPVGGDAVASWVNPTSLLGGAMAVAACAYLAAVFLVAEARTHGATDLERWFRRRAMGSATAAGALAISGIFVLHADSTRLFHQLLGPGLPFVLVSAASGVCALALLGGASPRLLRVLAVLAVASIIMGWGVAQYPFVLGTHLRIAEASAPAATLRAVAVIFGAAAVLCIPSLVALYVLQQRGRLEPS